MNEFERGRASSMPAAAAAASSTQAEHRDRASSLQQPPQSSAHPLMLPPLHSNAAAHHTGGHSMDTGKFPALPLLPPKETDSMHVDAAKGTGGPWMHRTNEDAHAHSEAHEPHKPMEQQVFFQHAQQLQQHVTDTSPTKQLSMQHTTHAAAATKTEAPAWHTAFPPPQPLAESHGQQHAPHHHSQHHHPSSLTPPMWSRPLEPVSQPSSSAAHTSSTPWLDSAGLGQSLSPRLSHSFHSPLGEPLRHLPPQTIAPMAPLRAALEPINFMHALRQSPSLNLPMQAKTLETQSMRGVPSLPTSRRPSLSAPIGETDGEEQDDSMSQASSRRGSFSFGPSMMSRGVMSMHGLALGSMLSPGSTAPPSGASSGATSPMRRFQFETAPKVVATLIPRVMTSLQIAGRNTEEERRKKQMEAGRMLGAAGAEEDVEEADEAMEESGAPAAAAAGGSGGKKRSLSGASQTAAARAKKLKSKKTRRALAVDTANGGAAGAGDAAAAAAGESGSRKKKKITSPLHNLASTVVAHAARLSRRPAGRRKSVPPTFFDELSSSAPNSASGASAGIHDDVSDEEEAAPRSPSPPKTKTCELMSCKKLHAGTYGGGRFCGAHCARQFSIEQRWFNKHGREQEQEQDKQDKE